MRFDDVNKRMSYLRLLKLLYIADREWLAETGESITGDRACAMKQGPVLSTVYDLVKGDAALSGRWDDFIHNDGYRVTLVRDPGRDTLSRGMIDKLNEVTVRHREDADWSIVDITHTFPEWETNFDGGSTLIPWQDISTAMGKPEMIAVVEREAREREAIENVFGPEP